MNWVLLSLSTALMVSFRDLWLKGNFSHLRSAEMAAVPMVYSLPFSVALFAFIETPELKAPFWWCFLSALPLEAGALMLYMHAIRISPISLTVPYLALSPAFVLISGYLLLGETPNAAGLCGIVSILVGGYVLNIDTNMRDFMDPLRAILHERGSRLMIIVALIYSITSTLGKKAIQSSSPLFLAVFYWMTLSLVMPVVLVSTRKISMRSLMSRPTRGAVAGGIALLEIIVHAMAVSLTKVAYMVSLKRTSILFSVALGAVLFRERQILTRLAGALMMVGGAVLISLWGK